MHTTNMIGKILMKNAVLVTGIILMALFIYDIKKRGVFIFDNEKYRATSCKSALVMLKRRMADDWSVRCQANEMIVEIKRSKDGLPSDGLKMKTFIYRELANHLIFIAKNTLTDSLERVENINVIFKVGESIELRAFTAGINLARLKSLTSQEMIADHMMKTVQIQEKIQ